MNNLQALEKTYLDYCRDQKELNDKTLKAYGINLKQFLSFIPTDTLPVTKEMLSDYLTYIHKQYKPKSVKRKIASIKAFFHYLEYEEIILENPFNKLRLQFREPVRLPKTIPLHIYRNFSFHFISGRKSRFHTLQAKSCFAGYCRNGAAFCHGDADFRAL